MRRALVFACTVGATLLSARLSRAEGKPFSTEYPSVLTFENFGGAMYMSDKTGSGDKNEATTVGTFTSFVPLSQPLPQIGFHYFVAPPISVGLGFHYSDRDLFGKSLELAPRVGVAVPFDSGTALWLRGGITYFSYEFGFLGKTTFSGIAPGAEALFVLQPVDHFGFMVGARFLIATGAKAEADVTTFNSATGASSSSTQKTDFDMMQAGITVGILTDF
jgi:hypothetical protein